MQLEDVRTIVGHLHASLQARKPLTAVLRAVVTAATDSRVRALLAAEGVLPVLLEALMDRANTEEGPIAVGALAALCDAEATALEAFAQRALERKADLLRLVYDPAKAPSAASLLEVLASAMPSSRPLLLEVCGSFPILGSRLNAEGNFQLVSTAAKLVRDPELRDLFATPAGVRWLAALLTSPQPGAPPPRQPQRASKCSRPSPRALGRRGVRGK